MVHKGGDTCNHVKDPSTIGTEEEDTCADCMSGSPSSGGSSQSTNGKGKKKKGKNKDKKVNKFAFGLLRHHSVWVSSCSFLRMNT